MQTIQHAKVTQMDTTLVEAERCDQCSAHANALAMKNNTTLLFCRHHYNVNADSLKVWAENILLYEVPS